MFAFQMGKRSEEAVEKIDLGRDVNASIQALGGLSATRERPLKPVPYNNFYVGPCKDLSEFKDLASEGKRKSEETRADPSAFRFVSFFVSAVFGVSLQDYAFARGISGNVHAVPILVEKCIKAIEERGLDAEGLYRFVSFFCDRDASKLN